MTSNIDAERHPSANNARETTYCGTRRWQPNNPVDLTSEHREDYPQLHQNA
jgi:hypothetical protein